MSFITKLFKKKDNVHVYTDNNGKVSFMKRASYVPSPHISVEGNRIRLCPCKKLNMLKGDE